MPKARALGSGWDWTADKRAEQDLTVAQARKRTVQAIVDAIESLDRRLVEALPTMGKSYGAVLAAARTGVPMTTLASVRETHVAQAAGRYARSPEDPDATATVYIRTDPLPEGFADVQVLLADGTRARRPLGETDRFRYEATGQPARIALAEPPREWRLNGGMGVECATPAVYCPARPLGILSAKMVSFSRIISTGEWNENSAVSRRRVRTLSGRHQ